MHHLRQYSRRRVSPFFFHRYYYHSNPDKNNDKSAVLLRFLRDKIRMTGPMSVYEYMQTCMGIPLLGYYAQASTDELPRLGLQGDFVTSPEISQMFGELIGAWCHFELAMTGHRRDWQLVELGPGTGQLCADLLRVLRQFRGDTDVSVHLVEMSDAMIAEQEKTLCGNEQRGIAGTAGDLFVRSSTTSTGRPVFWYRSLFDVPAVFSVFIAHEFLDALPVHQFKRVGPGSEDWREVFVDMDEQVDSALRFVLSPTETVHSRGLLPEHVRRDAALHEWEVNKDAGVLVALMAERLTLFGGIGLLIDYGHAGDRRRFSLRSFSQHRLANPLECPGSRDLTADVDFGYLRSIVADRVCVYGPISQRQFLTRLGIEQRLQSLLAKCVTDDQRCHLQRAYHLMTSVDEMGARFKVLALFPRTLATILNARGGPTGFSDDNNTR